MYLSNHVKPSSFALATSSSHSAFFLYVRYIAHNACAAYKLSLTHACPIKQIHSYIHKE